MKREKWKEKALAAEADASLWRTAYKAAYDEWKKLKEQLKRRKSKV